MKIIVAILGLLLLSSPADAKEKPKQKSNTVPGPYPPIIQLDAVDGTETTAEKHLYQSELGGREMQFLQAAHQAGLEQLALAAVVESRQGSEQIKAVAETIASTQGTESKEIARLAAAKKVTLASPAGAKGGEGVAALSGGKFEKAWIEKLIAINESGVAAYEIGTQAGDADIRTFAEKMLPVARARLQMANRLGGRSVPPPTEPAAAKSKTAPPAGAAPEPESIPPPIVQPTSPAKP